jgi:hypothetical protein
MCERHFGPSHIRTALISNNLAMILSNIGDLDAALEVNARAYEVRL